MGAWGAGLYSSDFALDLRGMAGGVARLPFEASELLDLLRETERAAADDPADSDHTSFWLVVADQFAKRGIDCPEARERAREIIASGADLAAMTALGMDAKTLAKRRAMLAELGDRLAAAPTVKPRKILRAPQKLLLEVGEASVFPVCKGEPINPYAVGKPWAWVKAWKQDGWGALVVAERGLLFDYLAWYRPLVICEPLEAEPTLATLLEPRAWLLRTGGTLNPRHVANLQLKRLGRVEIDPARLDAAFPDRRAPWSPVVSDISMSNDMRVGPIDPTMARLIEQGRRPERRISSLLEVTSAVGAGQASHKQ